LLIVYVVLQAVTLHTDLGDIKLELFCDLTPKTCEVVPDQGVVTTNSPVEPSATGIKIKSSDQELNLH